MKAHKPPSKIKYDKSHPTVSIRVTRELYDRLKELREQGGKTLGDILREALKQQAPSTKKAYQLGLNVAKQQFAVSYKCSVCGETMTVRFSNERKAIAGYMQKQGWRHNKCVG